jgi:hypothetical protein
LPRYPTSTFFEPNKLVTSLTNMCEDKQNLEWRLAL